MALYSCPFAGPPQKQQKKASSAASLANEWGEVEVEFPADFAQFQHPPEGATLIKASTIDPFPP